jgi:dihydroorotate dehydrogenase (fumarate)
MDLATSYLGLRLNHPFVLGASPLTGNLDQVRRLEDAGCAGIVMHSLFEERCGHTSPRSTAAVSQADDAFSGLADHFLSSARADELPLQPDDYLEQLRKIKAAVSVPIVASMNGSSAGAWLSYAPLLEQAGADALEINLYAVSTDLRDSALAVEQRIETMVRTLKQLVQIPVAVKLAPFYTALASFAARLADGGADGLVLFNRFYQPDVDVETLEVLPNLRLSTSGELLLRLRWLAILSERIPVSLAVTGGVHTVVDGIKALLCGAHAVQLVSAVLQQGPQHFQTMERGLRYWMTRHQLDSIDAFRGIVSVARAPNPAQLERTGYLRVLQSWPSALPVQDSGLMAG